MREENKTDLISVLSRRYHAVYYVDAKSKTFDIIYQEGHVQTEVNPVIDNKPKFADAMNMFVNNFVHPDDVAEMRNLIDTVYERLEHSGGFRHEFRRNFNGTYLYTEMNVTKVEAPDAPLEHFVVGFTENDVLYQMLMDQQKQLETIVTERTRELRDKNQLLNQINEDVIGLLGTITEARDLNSGEHVRRVKGFVKILAKQVQGDWPQYDLTDDRIELMTSASVLHDVGKIMIPDSILLKPGPLTKDEFEIMKTHCEKGCEILQEAPEGWSDSYKTMSYNIIRFHHEKYDGNGYPDHLVGDEIPICAQIVSIADCFDALTSKRPYKEAYSVETAFNMILEGECGVINPKLLESMINCKKQIIHYLIDTSETLTSLMPAGISTESLSWATILLVDDNAMGLMISADMLEGEGAKVITATNGKEAIDKFNYMPSGSIDAIIMDVVMPVMDGYEATRSIRALDRADAKTVPIIALTSLGAHEDIDAALDAGMNAFITKPVSISAFTKVLYECLNDHSEAFSSAVEKIDSLALERLKNAIERNPRFTSLSRDYSLVAYIDGNTNDIVMNAIDELQGVLDTISTRLPNNRRFDYMLKSIIPKEQFYQFLKDVDRNRLVHMLHTGKPFNVFFNGRINGNEQTYRLRIIEDVGVANCFLLGIQSIDAELRGEVRAQGLIEKLTEFYMVVDYIDLEEDTFQVYHEYARPREGKKETGCFSEKMEDYIAHNVVPKERNKVRAFVDINNIRDLMRRQKKAAIRLRDNYDGKPKYYEMSFINANENADGRYAILLVSDIDDDVRREAENRRLVEETRHKLTEIELKAYTDPLTEVNNITAFADVISDLSDDMRSDDNMKFAVVMCDINDLKAVNDVFGHDVGDIYIKNNAKIMKEVFSRSKIFRTGGDEFVVLLENEEYEYRDALLEQLRARLEEAESFEGFREGKASFAYGVGIYDPEQDTNVSEVVKRADMNMYEHKKESKRGR